MTVHSMDLSTPPPTGASASRGTRQLRRRITAAGLVLILLIVGADSYEAWQDYRAVIDANRRSQLALNHALAQQTARLVQQVDMTLGDSARWAAAPGAGAAAPAEMRERLRLQFARLPFIRSAWIIGPHGEPEASTSSDAEAGRTFADEDSFTALLKAGDAAYVGRAVPTAHDGAPAVTVSRRLEDGAQRFAGVVVAEIDFDYLVGFYTGVNITPGTSIQLLRKDGTLLAQHPAVDGAALKPDPGRSAVDEIVTHEGVDGYPLVVQVRRLSAGVMRPWIQQELSSAARTIPLAILAAVLLIALLTSLRRRDRLDDERHRLETELAAAQRADALGFLAAAVAHDFNNVLSAIIGYAEITRAALSAADPAVVTLDRLLAAAERARLLVRRILTFDTHRSVKAIPVSIEPIVAEVTEQLEATLPPGVRIVTGGAGTRAAVRGDPTEIYQVLMNLCSNGIKAMAAGGTLTIGVENLELHAVRKATISQLRPGNWVCITVSDTGVGLPPQAAESIFEPFYTTRAQNEGTGIGLTVVRNIVLSMGGALDASSRAGAGTQMAVYLPRTHAPVQDALPAPSPGHGQTILVVDDEAELVAVAEEVLASLGYEPVGFDSARLALEAFRRDPQRFDAVLTDERMGSMRGIELAKAIHGIRPAVPIVLTTAHRNADLERQAGALGIVEILDKPLRAQTLEACLGRWLTGKTTP
jgi:signal transduction histidine kinase/ActR/RegA family two-component response regulator